MTIETNDVLYPALPVMLVDDDVTVLQVSERLLRDNGITNVIACSDSREVIPLLSDREVGILVLDLSMPHVSGQDILARVMREYPDVVVIIATGAHAIQTAVECMRAGAFDFLTKPLDRNRLVATVRRAIDLRDLRLENVLLRHRMLANELEHPEAFERIVTGNPKMKAVFQYVEAVSRSAQPVLVSGETGTGKELIARAIHDLSGRQGDFVPVNVAGLDDTLFSDTLFGHVSGAFTGAAKSRGGLVEKAAGGTLFLDEIGDLSMPSQVKLLRLLQEREYFALGSDTAKTTTARIVVATNRNLAEQQAAGHFRKDLYYRLQIHHVHLPPLRERMDDLPLLFSYFLHSACADLGKKRPAIPKETFILMGTYSFPGNVRDLESMVFDAVSRHRARTMSLDVFREHMAKESVRHPRLSFPRPERDRGNPFKAMLELPTLDEARQMLIDEAYERAQQNQTAAARLLGVTQQALSKHMRTRMEKTGGPPSRRAPPHPV